MKVKIFEIRDKGTFIPILAIDMNPDDEYYSLSAEQQAAIHYLMHDRCGYPFDSQPNIAITHLAANGRACWNDPYAWGGRTYLNAHNYIIENWHKLSSGDVIDVEFILSETASPKLSERLPKSQLPHDQRY